MISIRDQLLSEIETYIAASGMTATDFGRTVMNDSAFVHRLRGGLGVKAQTIDKVRAWMVAHPLDRPRRRPRRTDSRAAA